MPNDNNNASTASAEEDPMREKLTKIWSSPEHSDAGSESGSLKISDSISNQPWFEAFMKDKEERDDLKNWRETLISLLKIDLNTHKDLLPPDTIKQSQLNSMTLEELETVTLELNKTISLIQLEDIPEQPEAKLDSDESETPPSIFTVSSGELNLLDM